MIFAQKLGGIIGAALLGAVVGGVLPAAAAGEAPPPDAIEDATDQEGPDVPPPDALSDAEGDETRTYRDDALGAQELKVGKKSTQLGGVLNGFELRGALELDAFAYMHAADVVDYNDNVTQSRSQITSAIELSHVNPDYPLALKLRLELRKDFSDPSRDRIILREGYTRARKGNLEVQIGRLMLAWGSTTVIHAVDEIAPADFSDFIDVERIAVPAVRLSYAQPWFDIEAIVLAQHVPHTLPDQRSRWLLGLFKEGEIKSEDATFVASSDLEPYVDRLDVAVRAERPSGQLEPQLGLRSTLRFSAVDVSFYYLLDRQNFPSVHVAFPQAPVANPATNDSVIPVELRLWYPRYQMLGASFETTIGQLALSGEGALDVPLEHRGLDPLAEARELRYVLEASYVLAPLFSPAGRLTLLVEGFQTLWDIPKTERRVLRTDILDRQRIFDFGALLALRYDLASELSVSVGALSPLKTRDIVGMARVAYRPWDSLSVETYLLTIDAGRNSPLHPFRNNDRLGIRVAHSF